MTNKVVGLRLSDATVRYADALASHFGVSRSAIVSLAVALLWERLGEQVVSGGPKNVPAVGPGEVRDVSWEQESGLINALTNAQPGQASVWACGGCPVSIRNITEALLTNDVERHTADGMERPANLSGMIPVFLIRHV